MPNPTDVDFIAPLQHSRVQRADSSVRLIKGALKFFQGLIENRFPDWSHVRHQARWD